MKPVALRTVEPSTAGEHDLPQEQPLRLLVVREHLGDLPWMVKTMRALMAPIDVVQVSGLANALWRVGRERFDAVLLDLDPRDRAVASAWRRHLAEVVTIPILELNSGDAGGPCVPAEVRPAPTTGDERRHAAAPATGGRRPAKRRPPALVPIG